MYLSEEAFLRWQHENAVFIAVDEAEARRKLNGADRGWVEVEGVFDAKGPSVGGCLPGGIRVERIGPWPPSWQKFPEEDPRSKTSEPRRQQTE